MDINSKIFVAGSNGMVGSAILRKLKSKGYKNILTKSRLELNLLSQTDVDRFFEEEKPEYVFLCAAKVGGILANNTQRAQFIYENLTLQSNVIHSSYVHNVSKLLFLGSSCIYPKLAEQPMLEEYLLTGPLEYTNEPYAIAKIAGIKMCESYRDTYGCNFISVMPTNLYGPGDNYDLKNSHVLPALIRKYHEAKINKVPEVIAWGTGSPMREFLYVEDMADACIFLMNNYNEKEFVNIGTGADITIKDLTKIVAETVGYEGKVVWDTTKPDGTPRKLLDVSRLNKLGWQFETSLKDGIQKTYLAFLEELNSGKLRGL